MQLKYQSPDAFLLQAVAKVRQAHGMKERAAKPQETESTIRFSAKLFRPEATEKIGSWTVLTLPKNASAELPSRGMTMVEGTINGFPFRAALEPDGKGSHWLRVNKVMQDAAGADAGDTVTVEITRTGEEPEIRVPTDLRKALAVAPLAQTLWAEITPMARRDWILWISSAKQPETRRGRIEKACSMLASGKRRVCCFGGLNWLTKDHKTANMASVAEVRKSSFSEIDKVDRTIKRDPRRQGSKCCASQGIGRCDEAIESLAPKPLTTKKKTAKPSKSTKR